MTFMPYAFPVIILLGLVFEVWPRYREDRAEWRLWFGSGLLVWAVASQVSGPIGELLMATSLLLLLLSSRKKLRR
jgi:hypothetical protein